MRVLKLVSGLVGLFALASAGAFAADLDIPPMKPAMDTGLYVRGDVGVGINTTSGFSNDWVTTNGGTFCGTCGANGIGDTPFVSAGIGMEMGGHFRLEAAAEYRGSSDVTAMDEIVKTNFGGVTGQTLHSNTEYSGHLRSVVGMVNGYYDIFNFNGFTPYVGAGVGFAYNMIDNLNAENISSVTCGGCTVRGANYFHAANAAKFNLAWSLMAGTSYDISQNGKLDIGYRYLNLGAGDAVTSGVLAGCGSCTGTMGNLRINDLASHEMRVGVRWLLD